MELDAAALIVNGALFIATAGAAAVAWWQAIEASRARTDARAAQRSALTSWQDASAALLRANDISGYAMRAPFAHALHDLATALLGARSQGADQDALIRIVQDKIFDITEKRFSAGDVPADAVFKWASLYPRHADIGVDQGFDFERWHAATNLVRERILLWLRDPAEGDRVIRADPRVDLQL